MKDGLVILQHLVLFAMVLLFDCLTRSGSPYKESSRNEFSLNLFIINQFAKEIKLVNLKYCIV